AHRRVDDDARSHTRAKDLPHNNFAGSMQVHVAGEPGDSGDKMKGHLVHVEEMRFRAQVEGAPEVLFDAGDQPSRRGPSPMQATLLATMACTAWTSCRSCERSACRSVPWRSMPKPSGRKTSRRSSRRFASTIGCAGQTSRKPPSSGRSTCHPISIARSESCFAARAWSLSTRMKFSRWSDVFSGHELVPGMFKQSIRDGTWRM